MKHILILIIVSLLLYGCTIVLFPDSRVEETSINDKADAGSRPDLNLGKIRLSTEDEKK